MSSASGMSSGPAPSEYYRAGAGLVIANKDGLILAFERAGGTGQWQLPQGGLAAGEQPFAAATRELHEETRIPAAALSLIAEYPGVLAYELPDAHRSARTGRGQVHHWFLVRFEGTAHVIDLASEGEFAAWRWMALDELASIVAPFKRAVYRELVREFRPCLQALSHDAA